MPFLMTSVHIVLLICKLWSADSAGWSSHVLCDWHSAVHVIIWPTASGRNTTVEHKFLVPSAKQLLALAAMIPRRVGRLLLLRQKPGYHWVADTWVGGWGEGLNKFSVSFLAAMWQGNNNQSTISHGWYMVYHHLCHVTLWSPCVLYNIHTLKMLWKLGFLEDKHDLLYSVLTNTTNFAMQN